MSPASGWVSSPATGPQRSSAPTPPRRIHYARRAAERALEQLAPDEAARWYRQALELHDQAPVAIAPSAASC